PLLTPELENGHDDCLTLLESGLQNRRGILRAHVKGGEDGAEQLCLHYDPNLISLDKVERIAREAGSAFTNRYRHERIAFAGMDAADAAGTLRKALERVAGVLHADVNYAAGLIFVAYDSAQVGRGEIDAAIGRLGYRVVEGDSQQGEYDKDHEAGDGHDHDHEGAGEGGHDHGSAPAFLPHWMQERWTLLLVGLAGLFFLIGWLGTTFFGLSENIALIFYILAYIAGGYDIATHAIPGLFKGNFDTDVLMLAAAAGAALLGEWAEGAFLLFLFSLGHAGEHYALDRARNAVNALGELMPKTARVRRGDQLVEEPVAKLQVGDVVVVRPGDRVPVDGEVVAGDSVIDQSPITGESVPVNKTSGDEVFAGTINQSAALDIQVTRLANDNTLSRVMQLVAEAQSQQSPTQQFTQKFTSKFVPAVLVVTLLVIIVPPLFDWMTLQESFYRAMLLLVAASPCALALGTPATVLAGIAQAARNGVLIKGGVHLENLGDVQVMAFDKTGTLTEGDFAVTDIVPVSGVNAEQLLSLTAAVEQQSNHPLALAIVSRAEKDGLALPVADGLENVVGRGVKSSVAGEEILIGSLKLFRETAGHKIDTEIVQQVEQFERDG
ncbi:MAG TPA: cadmium-translocating P-type ATPase, partial [Anaerolineae bacterium]|nr:cadmium-translocating P-type ATPase [Anaerolineae bacterium]